MTLDSTSRLKGRSSANLVGSPPPSPPSAAFDDFENLLAPSHKGAGGELSLTIDTTPPSPPPSPPAPTTEVEITITRAPGQKLGLDMVDRKGAVVVTKVRYLKPSMAFHGLLS